MDSIFAIVGTHGLRDKAEIFLSSSFRNALPGSSTFSTQLVASQTHFVYFAAYSKTAAGEYVVEHQEQVANHRAPVLASSRIDNRAELAQGLARQRLRRNRATADDHEAGAEDYEADLQTTHSPTDEELLLQLYKVHGARFCEQVRGSFCYILWDEELKQVHAAIDPFNARSLFYMQLEDLLYVASDARLLASHPHLSVTVNKLALAQWLKGQPDPFMSMFNEISMLPNGHRLVLSPDNSATAVKFWDINPDRQIRYANPQEYEAHFFNLLYASVAARMQSNSPVIFSQMSGGMDSTSITALANMIAPDNGQQLHTISHSYSNTESCDELDKIQLMVEHLQLQNTHYIELDAFDKAGFNALYPTDFDNPGIVLSPKYHQELVLIETAGANVLLTGNGGDETCWGHSATYRSRLLHGEIGVIAEVMKACKDLGEPVARSLYNLFVSPFIPNVLVNLSRLARKLPRSIAHQPAWLTKTAMQLIELEGNPVNPYSSRFNPAKHARYESIKTTSTYNSMRSYQKVANHYGVDVRHPFFDQAIVEFSFAIPEKLLIQGIYPKWLLRRTMQDHLPEAVCWNRHKVVFDRHFANLVRSNAEEIRRLLAHTGLQELGLVDNEVLLEKFAEVTRNPEHRLNVDMLYAILTQSWFQQHCLD